MGFLKKGIRILAEAAALCLLLTALPAPVQAQEAQTGQDSRTVLTTKVDGHPDTVEKGSGEVTLDDGTAVTVEGDSLPDGLLFVVEHIRKEENGETHDWIEKCMEGLGTNLRVYDIYFVDSNGQRYEVDGKIAVTISLDGAYRNLSVYYVSEQGSVTRMESSVSGGKISFATTHNSYYVLAEQPEASTEPTPTPTPGAGSEPTPTPTPGDGTEPTPTPTPGDSTEPTPTPTPGDGTEPTPTPMPGDSTEPTTTPTPGAGADNQGTGNGTGGNSTTQGTAAKTGDETNVAFWLFLFVSSAIVCISGMIFHRKRVS